MNTKQLLDQTHAEMVNVDEQLDSMQQKLDALTERKTQLQQDIDDLKAFRAFRGEGGQKQ